MSNTLNEVVGEVKKVIHGKDTIIKMTLSAILAGGHVLLEDIPGVGKTTLAMSFAKALSMDYRRMQFTPDVMPSDLVGFNMYEKSMEEFRFREGAVFTNLFLADEINRTSPKTQSALLEVMEEKKATVEGVTRPLPTPFFVIATQNPFGSSGTQKLPESQLDRFMVCLSIGYPDSYNAIKILKGDSSKDISNVVDIVSKEELIALQQRAEDVYVDDSLYEYIVSITEGTRRSDIFDLGLSPRGSIALLKMSKAYALMEGRDYVLPKDIQTVYMPVSGHRVKLSGRSRAAGLTLETALNNVINDIPVPKTTFTRN